MLPFENLAADPSLDWMSRGFSESLVLQLTGCPAIEPVSVPTLRDASSIGATRILQGYFSVFRGRLRAEAVLENTATRRMAETASAAGDNIVEVTATLARQIDPGARPAGTKSVVALKALVQAMSASGAPAAAKGFEQAVAADPAFGAAYVAWAQWLVARGDSSRAREVITAARGRGNQIQEIERNRLDLLAAEIRGDRAAERCALDALNRATPADAGVYRSLAGIDLAAHGYASAVQEYEKALERDPDDVLLLNQLGYAEAYARNFESATKTLSRYRDLRPADANPLDSLGDVHFYLGRFGDAARYYLEAYSRDPSFLAGGDLYKAAWATLMAGDRKGAGGLLTKFLEARQGFRDALVPYRQAQWEYLTGSRKQAIGRLSRFADTAKGAAGSLAFSELAIWSLETGDRGRAHAWAMRAAPAGTLTTILRFLTGPPATPSEWAARAEDEFPRPAQSGVKEYALSYALLFAKEFAAAVPKLTRLYQQTPPSSLDEVNALLAWAFVESGQLKEAGPLLETNAIPDPIGEHVLLSLGFPRVFYLRGVWLERQGRREEARMSYRRFLDYSGDLPMIFGEEQRAKAALARL